MATSKKKTNDKKATAEKSAEPKAEPTQPEADPTPERIAREAPKRSDDETKAIRTLVKKGEKALETLQSVLDAFDPEPERAVKSAMKRLSKELEALKPPEPRKCKEYKRALALARKGEMGIHPDDIMKYCRCNECHVLREKAGLEHPPAPRAAS